MDDILASFETSGDQKLKKKKKIGWRVERKIQQDDTFLAQIFIDYCFDGNQT